MPTKSKSNPFEHYRDTYPWIDQALFLPGTGVAIIELPPKLLTANPKNWRIHSQRQRSTYNAFKDKYGWLGFIIFNLQTGKLLDGHMRVDEALRSKERLVPVRIVDVNEEQENEILATFDSIGLLAQKNNQALESLLKSASVAPSQLKSDAERKLAQLRNDLSAANTSQSPLLPQAKTRIRPLKEEPLEPQSPEVEDPDKLDPDTIPNSFIPSSNTEAFDTIIDPNVLFPGLTWAGIPILLSEKLATPDIAPTRTWNGKEDDCGYDAYYCYSQSFYEDTPVGTIGFYTDDRKFNSIYSDPAAFIEWLGSVDPRAIISPDFSAYSRWPGARNLFAIYQSRWCSRLMQEAGYLIIPTIQIMDFLPLPKNSHTQTFILETIPEYAPVISMECRLDSPEDSPKLVSLIKSAVDVIKPECVILYAGEEKQKYIHGDLPKNVPGTKTKIEYRYLPQIITLKKRSNRYGQRT